MSITVLGIERKQTQGFADSDVRRNVALLASHLSRAVKLGNSFGLTQMAVKSPLETPGIVQGHRIYPVG